MRLRLSFFGVALVTLILSASCGGSQGPAQGTPQGLPSAPGPPGSSGPYVWICTPAFQPQSNSNPNADLYVHNPSSSAANVSVNILNKDGNNLVGQNIPGTSSVATYPGEAIGATAQVAPNQTRIVNWQMPRSGAAPAADVSVAVRVSSDQPVVVASNFHFNPPAMPNVCHQAK